MILSRRRSFIYPILSELTNDYVDGSKFDLAISRDGVEHTDKSSTVIIKYSIALDNAVLVDALLDKNAQVLIELSCPTTWFRTTRSGSELAGEVSIPAALVDSVINVSASIVVASDDFRITFSGIHVEYGRNFTYSFDAGMPLAISPEWSVELEFAETALRNLIHIRKSVSERDDSYSIDLSSNQIVVNMGKNFHQAWGILFANADQKPILYMSIYKDCVASAVQALAAPDAVDEYLWARTFREKIELLGLKVPTDPKDWNACNEIALTLLGEKGVRRIVAHAERTAGI